MVRPVQYYRRNIIRARTRARARARTTDSPRPRAIDRAGYVSSTTQRKIGANNHGRSNN